jgi:hypothetical protein
LSGTDLPSRAPAVAARVGPAPAAGAAGLTLSGAVRSVRFFDVFLTAFFARFAVVFFTFALRAAAGLVFERFVREDAALRAVFRPAAGRLLIVHLLYRPVRPQQRRSNSVAQTPT